MDVPCCQDFRSRQEALRNAAAAVGWGRGGFVWPPHPSPGEISMPWILPRLQALFYALRGCSIRDWRTAEPWLCFVEKENKATGYISAYYNVAGQDKANYTSPTRHHGEIHCAILIIFFFALWWIKDSLVFFFFFFLILIPRRRAGGETSIYIWKVLAPFSRRLTFFGTFAYDWLNFKRRKPNSIILLMIPAVLSEAAVCEHWCNSLSGFVRAGRVQYFIISKRLQRTEHSSLKTGRYKGSLLSRKAQFALNDDKIICV